MMCDNAVGSVGNIQNKESKGIYRNLLLTKRPTSQAFAIPMPKIHMHHRWPPSDPTKARLLFCEGIDRDSKYPVPLFATSQASALQL